MVGALLKSIDFPTIVQTVAIGWGHCAPSSCTKEDFFNNYRVSIYHFYYS